MKLPAHILQEARALKAKAGVDNPITEPQARPLLTSTAIWLLKNGTCDKESSPGVIGQASVLLHAEIPLHLLHTPKGAKYPTDFATRIFGFFQNHVTRSNGAFKIQVAHDEVLNTPLRALDQHGLVKRLDPDVEPKQGHSGRSIFGKGRKDIPAPDNAEVRGTASPVEQPELEPVPPPARPRNV